MLGEGPADCIWLIFWILEGQVFPPCVDRTEVNIHKKQL